MPAVRNHLVGCACVVIGALHCLFDVGNASAAFPLIVASIPALAESMLVAASLALVLHLRQHRGLFAYCVVASHASNLAVGWLELMVTRGVSLGLIEGILHGPLAASVLSAATVASLIEIGRLAGSRRMFRVTGICAAIGMACVTARAEESLPLVPPISLSRIRLVHTNRIQSLGESIG